MDAQGNPMAVEEQQNIINVIPGDENYTAFRQVNLVTVPPDYISNTFKSSDAVIESGYPVSTTDNLVNCPVYDVAQPTASPLITPFLPTPDSGAVPEPQPGVSPSPTSTPSPVGTPLIVSRARRLD
jgi:hypothetical protein